MRILKIQPISLRKSSFAFHDYFGWKKIVIAAQILFLTLVLIASPVYATDGSGTNIVSPNSTTAGSTGGTYAFTFTAAETMNSGGISISTAPAWSSIQGTSGVAGYTTVASTGVTANVEDNADSSSGWAAGNGCNNGLTLDTTVLHEGTGSIKCTTGAQSSGNVWYKNITSENWSAYTHVGFWIRVAKNISSGNLRFAYDNNNNLASPISRKNLPAITANTWTYVTLTLSGTRTSILSYGFNINNNNNLDNTTVNIDDVLLGPGSPSFSSGTVNVRLLTLTSGQTVTVTYGSGGGASGATAPSTGRISTFTTQTRVSDSGALTGIATSPIITVNNPVPTTTSVSPTSTTAGGTQFALTVNGTNFNASSTVNWNGSARTTTYVSATQITASILASDIVTAGTATVTVFNPTPGGGTSNSQTFTINNPVPTTTSLSPTSATAGGSGFTLTVNGTNFVSNSVVNWNGSARTTTYVSATQLTASILSSDITTAGTSTVTVVNPTPGGGTSNSQTFTINNPVPTTTSISPNSKTVGDSTFTLTVNGTNFVSTSVVNWNGSARTTTYVSATQLTASIPSTDLTTGGTFNITVTNPTPGGGISNSQTFTVNNPVPTTTSINPTFATAGDPGFVLTVNGTNFVSTSVVNWNGSARTTTYVSATQLTASILSSDITTAGTSTITVVSPTPGGGASNSQTFTINNPVPTTTSISPTSATAGGSGFTLTVNGTNFVSNSVVNWNGSARATTYVSATQVTASINTSDIASVGTASVTVFNSTPGGGTSNSQTFTINNPVPTTTSISPTSANVGDPGFTLTVNGTNFVASSTVQLNGSNRATTYVSATQLSALILASDMNIAGTSTVTIVNPAPGGGTSNSQTFMVNNLVPTTTSINPTSKNVGDSGFTLTVDGTNFISSSVVNFNGSPRTTTFASSTELTASILTSDLTTAGNFNITVTSPTPGGGTSNAQTFTVNNLVPTISSITPSTKNAGDPAFTLTVNGTNYVSTSAVQWNGSSRTTTYVSSTQLTASILSSDIATAGTSTVTVFNPTPGGGTSNGATFTVAPVATKFVILPPSSGTVDAPITITVQAQKSDNSVDTNYQNDVTLVLSGSATGGGLVNIVNGVGTTTISDTVAETVHLSLSDSQSTGLDVSSTQDAVFSAGAITKFVINNPGDTYAKTRLGYTVTREDQYSNPVISGTSTVYLYTSSTSTAHAFYNASTGGSSVTSIPIAGGLATGQFWYYEETPGTYTITVSDNSTAPDGAIGIADSSDSVTVMPVAVKYVIITATSTSVDSGVTVTIQAQKSDNSIDTNWQQGVTLNTSGSATGGGLITITNGIGTAHVSDAVAETVHLSLTDSQSTGLDVSSSADVVFNVGALAQYSLSHPGTTGAGVRATYTLTRKDQFGNLVTSGTSTVYLYSSSSSANKKFYDSASGSNVITSINITDGNSAIQFWYYDDMLGSWTVTASDNSSAPDGSTGIIDAVDTITVTPGPVAEFYLNNPGGMTAGTRLGYIATRKDQFGNLVTSGVTTGYLYSSPPTSGTSTAFFDASSGGNQITSVDFADTSSTANFWYYQNTAGTYTLSFSDNASAPDGSTGIIDATSSVNVMAAPIVATKFVILAATSTSVDSSLTITIQAQDNSGNIDTSATSSVTLVTSGSATGGGLVTLASGVGTIQISDHVSETVHLSLSDTQGTGLNVSSALDVLFNPGAVDSFTLNNPGDTAAGIRLGYTVTRKDQYGNPVTSGATTVYLYSSSLGTHSFYNASSGGSAITSIIIPDGQSSVQFWYYDELSGTWNVIASDNATSPDGSTGIADAVQSLTVQPGAIAKFILNNPGNMTAGTRLGYTVTRKDQFNNLVTSGVTLAYLYTSSTGTSTKFYDDALAGSTITFAVINSGLSSANFWYYDNTPGIWNITVSDGTPTPNGATGIADAVDTVTVSSVPIVATKFVILPVSTSQINTNVIITIRAEDNSGNTQTTYNNSVTLDVSGSATGGGVVNIINGIGTVTISDSSQETINLSLTDSNSTGLDVSSVQSVSFVAQLVVPTGGRGGGISFVGPIPQTVKGVILSGNIFPQGKLKVIAYSQTQPLSTQTGTADSSGRFSITFNQIPLGVRSYGILATDPIGNSTQIRIFDANLVSVTDLISINGIMLSPTLGMVNSVVRKGDFLALIGSGNPGYALEVQIDGNSVDIGNQKVDNQGNYKILINTANMDLGSHTVAIRQISPSNTYSDFAPQKIFTVTNLFTPNLDFNGDGKIDLQDWSIFLSRWISTDPKVRILDDLNGDGKVDVSDFSIFARTLKLTP